VPKSFALFKDVDGKYFTFDEYKTLIKDNQTDKNGNLVYLYATNKRSNTLTSRPLRTRATACC
jgi:hypothetical protein